jgi:hypothetical protein
MTVVVDTANVVDDNTSFTGTASSTTVTVATGDTVLLVFVGINYRNNPVVPPDSFTYGGVALTLKASVSVNATGFEVSVWTLENPPVGTATLVGTWTTNTAGGTGDVKAVPVSGAAGTFGAFVTAQSTANNNPAVTAAGASGGGDLYFGCALNGITITTSTGTGQTDVSNTAAGGSPPSNTFAVSTIPGSDTGAFTWTGSGTVSAGTQWGAIGFVVHAAASAAAPLAWIT